MANPNGTAQQLLGRLHELFRVLLAEIDFTSVPPPTPGQEMEPGEDTPGGKSENYAIMGIAYAAIWYHLAGNVGEAHRFLAFVKAELRKEINTGLMGGEMGCNAPHSGMHLGAVLLLHFFAWWSKSRGLYLLTGQWLSRALAWFAACDDGAGHAEIVGFRIDPAARPSCPIRDAALRASLGLPQDLPNPTRRRDPLVADRFWLGARAATLLAEKGLMPSPGPLPVLRYLVTISQWSNGDRPCYLSVLQKREGMRGLGQIVTWVLFDGREHRYGRSFDEDVPAAPSHALLLTTPEPPQGGKQRR